MKRFKEGQSIAIVVYDPYIRSLIHFSYSKEFYQRYMRYYRSIYKTRKVKGMSEDDYITELNKDYEERSIFKSTY